MAMMVAAMLAAAAAQGAMPEAPRKAFVECLKQSVEKARADKVAVGAFAPVARQACAGQITAFRTVLVGWDVKAGTPRKRAEADADSQIDDYLAGAAEKLDPGS